MPQPCPYFISWKVCNLQSTWEGIGIAQACSNRTATNSTGAREESKRNTDESPAKLRDALSHFGDSKRKPLNARSFEPRVTTALVNGQCTCFAGRQSPGTIPGIYKWGKERETLPVSAGNAKRDEPIVGRGIRQLLLYLCKPDPYSKLQWLESCFICRGEAVPWKVGQGKITCYVCIRP